MPAGEHIAPVAVRLRIQIVPVVLPVMPAGHHIVLAVEIVPLVGVLPGQVYPGIGRPGPVVVAVPPALFVHDPFSRFVEVRLHSRPSGGVGISAAASTAGRTAGLLHCLHIKGPQLCNGDLHRSLFSIHVCLINALYFIIIGSVAVRCDKVVRDLHGHGHRSRQRFPLLAVDQKPYGAAYPGVAGGGGPFCRVLNGHLSAALCKILRGKS